MVRDYKLWVHVGAIFAITVAVGWITLVVTAPRGQLPIWSVVLFILFLLIGVYFLVAGWAGLPVPIEKAERTRRREEEAAIWGRAFS